MPSAPVIDNETARIAALYSLDILDSPHEERFDRLTRIAKAIFEVPIALVSLVDRNRQWFKSADGLDACETSREVSFCAHAILGDDILVVEDAQADDRFCDNALVLGEPRIRFYAGCVLRSGAYKMGTLCLIDRQPRQFTERMRNILRDLAGMAERELEAMKIAITDELTGLSNRRGFEIMSRQAFNFSRRMKSPATLAYFDLNHFKRINDNFGHEAGDRALMQFADGLRAVFRNSDVIGRLGGDEFAVLFSDTSLEAGSRAILRLQNWLAKENLAAPAGREIDFSFGLAAYAPTDHPTIHPLLQDADAAMYRNKLKMREC